MQNSDVSNHGYPDVSSLTPSNLTEEAKPWVEWFNGALDQMIVDNKKSRTFIQEKIDHELVTELAARTGDDAPAPLVYKDFEAVKPLYRTTPKKDKKSKTTPVKEPQDSFFPAGIPETILPPCPSTAPSADFQPILALWLSTYLSCPARTALIAELERSRVLLGELCSNDTWTLTRDSHGTQTYYRAESGPLNSFKVVGTAHCGLLDLFSVIYESDLYAEWFPFMGRSDDIATLSRFHKIVHSEIKCPWPLTNRDMLLEATGVDDTARGRVIINVRDLPNDNEHYSATSGSLVRANMAVGGYMLELVSPECTRVSFYCNVDAKLILPSSILNMITGSLVHMIVSYMEKMAHTIHDPDSKYLSRFELHKEVYDDVRDIIVASFGEEGLIVGQKSDKSE